MAVDLQTFQATPSDDDTRALELLAECHKRLGGEWSLVSSSIKLSKTLFQAEFNGRRVIGKVSPSKRSRAAHTNSVKLHEAGMRPPSEFTVPEPIAWFDDLSLLVLEMAPGISVLEALQHPEDALNAQARAADWLHALHELKVDAQEDIFDVEGANKRAAELAGCINDDAVLELTSKATAVLAERPAVVKPSHGDYHPMNIFVADGRVTVIDLDTFAIRDPEADIGYFLAQSANFGLQMFDNFEATRALRDGFRSSFPEADEPRIAAHMAWALLRSVHYDVCILKIDNQHAGSMIRAARTVLA